MKVTHLLSPTDILWKFLEEYGLDAESIFIKEGITREMILEPGLRIHHAKVERLWKRIFNIIKDPCFGLKAAKHWHPSHFNALGFAWLSSSTLREAFNRASRYARIVGCDRETRIEEKENVIVITLSSALEFPPQMDLSMAILLSASRTNFGRELNPVGVNFIHDKPDCADEYHAFFNSPVEFNAQADRVMFSKKDTDKRLMTGNPYLAEIHDKYSIRYLDKIKRSSLVDIVKNEIIESLPSGKISDEDVAYKLNISSRSLQRKLNKKNTNFRSILNEVRKDIAKYYIHESTVSLMEIAFILGYSEYTSFSRAYKKWTGNSPGRDRKIGKSNLYINS
jgi:AraC-like DNA-binding protein